MTNLTLDQVTNTQVGELMNLNISQLYELVREANHNIKKYTQVRDWLNGSIKLKYQNEIEKKREAKGSDTGVVHIKDSGFTISEEVKKTVVWDDKRLESVAESLVNMGKDPRDYITSTLKVPDKIYKSLDPDLKDRFDYARTIKHGTPKLTISMEDSNV